MPASKIPAFMSWPIPVDGQDLWGWQRVRCAACATPGDLVLDHDHETGMTRGYLCRSCNANEARHDSPIWLLWRAGMNPAAIFGWAELYISAFTGLPVIEAPEVDGWRERAAAALDRPPRPSITADVYMGRKQGGKEAAEALNR